MARTVNEFQYSWLVVDDRFCPRPSACNYMNLSHSPDDTTISTNVRINGSRSSSANALSFSSFSSTHDPKQTKHYLPDTAGTFPESGCAGDRHIGRIRPQFAMFLSAQLGKTRWVPHTRTPQRSSPGIPSSRPWRDPAPGNQFPEDMRSRHVALPARL